MKVGITGTRNALTGYQEASIVTFFIEHENEITELHHGDCVGADNWVAIIAAYFKIKTVCHPPIKNELRAFHNSTEIRTPLNYLARNRNIVDETDMLLVVPYQDTHQPQGGTWYTHDYAVKKGKPREVFFPTAKS